jgi:DNA-binding Xre family transcriptional regulator
MTERRMAYLAETRASVWDACGGKCHYCGKNLNPFRDFEIDHAQALCAGGLDVLENLVGSCRDCNRAKRAFVDTPERNRVANMVDGKKLQRLRRDRGLSRWVLASAAGFLSEATILGMEEEDGKFRTFDRIQRIAAALDVEPRELLKDASE